MHSPEYIQQMNREAAAQASQDDLIPFVVYREDLNTRPFPFPDLGDYRPPGWELVDTYFCDSSGLGAPDEPAMSQAQLVDKLEENIGKGYGYGIIEVGQFQLYLGVFQKINTT